MKFWEFRENLFEQILTCKPTRRLYWGHDNTRVSVSQSLNKQKRDIPKKVNNNKNNINLNNFKKERHTRHKEGRICGDLENFQIIVLTKVNLKNPKAFELCGIDNTLHVVCTIHKCTTLLIKVEKQSKLLCQLS